MKIMFHDFEFSGKAIAVYNGKEIWNNFESGDCPPDIEMMYVTYFYVSDNVIVFELSY